MTFKATEFIVSDIVNAPIGVSTPTRSSKNYYGPVTINGETVILRQDNNRVYGGERPSVRQPLPDQYPHLQTIRIQVQGDTLAGFEAIDNAMLLAKDTIENYSQTTDLAYRPLVSSYQRKDGTTGHSLEISLDVHSKRMDYITIFYDEEDHQKKIRDYSELVAAVSPRSMMSIKFTAEYQVRPERKDYNVILRAKFIQIKPDAEGDEEKTESYPEARAISIGDLTTEVLKSNVTLVKGDDSMMTKQKMARLLFNDTPGKRFRLNEIKLHKPSETVYVGLPPKSYSDETTRTKLTLVPDGENLEFLDRLDGFFLEKKNELKSIWDLSDRTKMEYVPIVKKDGDAPVFKLELFEDSVNQTKFFIGNEQIKWETIEDLRPYIRLGTTLVQPTIVVSKIWHAKADKEYSVKLKLKSCKLVPPAGDIARDEYIKSGRFGGVTTITDEEDFS